MKKKSIELENCLFQKRIE